MSYVRRPGRGTVPPTLASEAGVGTPPSKNPTPLQVAAEPTVLRSRTSKTAGFSGMTDAPEPQPLLSELKAQSFMLSALVVFP
jgi:hypothetical protein